MSLSNSRLCGSSRWRACLLGWCRFSSGPIAPPGASLYVCSFLSSLIVSVSVMGVSCQFRLPERSIRSLQLSSTDSHSCLNFEASLCIVRPSELRRAPIVESCISIMA